MTDREKSRRRREMTLKKKAELIKRAELEEKRLEKEEGIKGDRKGSRGSKEVHLSRHPWCFICGKKGVVLELHHVKPIRNGGNSGVSNTCLLCDDCHVEYHILFDEELDKIWYLNEEETYEVFLGQVELMHEVKRLSDIKGQNEVSEGDGE